MTASTASRLHAARSWYMHLFSFSNQSHFKNEWHACAGKLMQFTTVAAGLASWCTRDRGLKLEVHTREGNPFKMSDLRKVRHAGLWLFWALVHSTRRHTRLSRLWMASINALLKTPNLQGQCAGSTPSHKLVWLILC
jgi:hypothetical protein